MNSKINSFFSKAFFKLFFIGIMLIANFNSGCGEDPSTADLVITNGKIITMDKQQPEAEALAVKGDSIMAVGRKADIEKLIGSKTKIIDLKGATAVPGLIESHAHFSGLGHSKRELELRNTSGWDEIVAMVAEAAKKTKPGAWIIGRGWHQEKWSETPRPSVNGYPYHYSLSKVSPDNPVMLSHASGHEIFVNAKAMELAGINSSTPNPEGGEILRDKNGKIVGVFKENAEGLINGVYQKYLDDRSPEIEKEDEIEALKLADKECLSKGITTFYDAGSSFGEVDLYKELYDKGELGVRLNVMLQEDNKSLKERIKEYKIINYANHHLTVRAIKKYIDGALGSRGAWMLAPYSDKPGSSGLEVTSLNELAETAGIAIDNGFQLCVHAIGDRGNREVLNIYEKTFKQYPGKKDLRWRIEHAQHLSAEDIPRFGELGVIAAMQTCHCTSDAVFVLKRLGEKRAGEGAYVWRKLIETGAVIANGTDAPVESVDPVKNYYSAVTRKLKDGSTFFPGQKMTRMEGLVSYTTNGAYAAFQENDRGKLLPGKLADVTVLSGNLLTGSDDEILNTKVLYTIVGGKVLYAKEK